MGRMAAAALVVAMTVVGVVGLAAASSQRSLVVERSMATPDHMADPTSEASDEGASAADAPEEPQVFVVHVDGAVGVPGVVRVEGADVRVFDAVDAAGGLLDDADTTSVNLAEALVDGSKIHIPHEGEEVQAEAPPVTGQASTMGATGAGEAVVLVNINTATAEELQVLSGIGEVTARAIVDDRTQNGPFASCEDLMRVSGIGEKKFERVRGSICV